MKMNVAMASTRKDTSRIANAGVDTGANMLGVGATAVATVIKGVLRGPPGSIRRACDAVHIAVHACWLFGRERAHRRQRSRKSLARICKPPRWRTARRVTHL